MQLIRPLYLDEGALHGYLASLEGGVRKGSTRSVTRSSEGQGKLGGMGLELGGQRARETIETEEIEEHDWSRLGRFIDLAEAKGAVIDLMDDPPVFAGMRTGEFACSKLCFRSSRRAKRFRVPAPQFIESGTVWG